MSADGTKVAAIAWVIGLWQRFRDAFLDFVVGAIIIGIWVAAFLAIPMYLLYHVAAPWTAGIYIAIFTVGLILSTLFGDEDIGDN